MKQPPLFLVAVLGLSVGCPAPDGDEPNSSAVDGADEGLDDGTPTSGPGNTSGVGSGDDAPAVTSGGSEGDGGTAGMNFIIEFDNGMEGFECDLFAQDCNRGEKCMPYANDGGPAWNSTLCVPLDANAAQVGDECMVEGSGVSGFDNCDIGLMCWNVDETGVGVCEDMCTGSADAPICENPDDACSIANGGAIVLCLPECDPLLQACAEGQACYPIDNAFVCAPDASGDLGVHGDPCEYINACDPGTVCIGADAFTDCAASMGCCSSVCSVSDPNADADCGGLSTGQGCEAWFVEGMAPPGYEDVGVCALPL